MELIRRVLGEKHPATSVSAWNLLRSCKDLQDSGACDHVVDGYLRWLVDCGPDSLGADQTEIRSDVHGFLRL